MNHRDSLNNRTIAAHMVWNEFCSLPLLSRDLQPQELMKIIIWKSEYDFIWNVLFYIWFLWNTYLFSVGMSLSISSCPALFLWLLSFILKVLVEYCAVLRLSIKHGGWFVTWIARSHVCCILLQFSLHCWWWSRFYNLSLGYENSEI